MDVRSFGRSAQTSRNGDPKTTLIGCDRKGCKFWAHANFAGLFLIPGKKVENHIYYCKKHKSSK